MNIIKSLSLIGGIMGVSYSMGTPGDQFLQVIGGALLLGVYQNLDDIEA